MCAYALATSKGEQPGPLPANVLQPVKQGIGGDERRLSSVRSIQTIGEQRTAVVEHMRCMCLEHGAKAVRVNLRGVRRHCPSRATLPFQSDTARPQRHCRGPIPATLTATMHAAASLLPDRNRNTQLSQAITLDICLVTQRYTRRHRHRRAAGPPCSRPSQSPAASPTRTYGTGTSRKATGIRNGAVP
jgi:hypothetical protein